MESFNAEVYRERLDHAQSLVATRGLSGLVIGVGAEFAYLTGSWISTHERLTALIVPPYGQPLIVAPKTDVGDLALSPIPELPLRVQGWSDGDNAHELAAAALGDTGPVALGASLTTNHVLRLQDLVAPRPTVLAASALKELFMRKDAAEIAALRGAAAAIDRVHEQVPRLLRPGRTEAEVAADIERLILREHSVVDFIIVGSGPNGANPHHSYSDRVIESGDPVVVDIGGTFGPGYHSDCTRTFVVGEPDAEFQRLYAVLAEAQTAARAAVRPGITAAAVDNVAREIISAAGYGEAFFHRTGHGIGLSTHEEPFIMTGNDLVLEPGMTFSIEPGIYLSGRYGARIEDIMLVTADGGESLNSVRRDYSMPET